MAPRAVWKGSLRVGELQCPVSLYTAVSTSDRIAFHTLNRKTGHRVHREFIDSETGKPVPPADQVKGYDTGAGQTIMIEPEEIAAAIPDNDKTLAIRTFVACQSIDTVYFDRPYYLTPSDPVGAPVFALLLDGLKAKKAAAIASAILFRRVRTVLIRAHDDGLIATLLKFDYEVRSAEDAFDSIPEVKIEDEMIELARHIIKTKMGSFDPKAFDDRYEEAVADLVRAKIEGRPLKARPAPVPSKASDLLSALRESAKAADKTKPASRSRRAPAKRAASSDKSASHRKAS
ncbi:non-homologous end joining protein Ku [Lichenifustis flavocetrariae]|uniref:Non-homologous end joining protein Ku n=1 Tax=Lichenifustis flavocetrariae TaxID=2949735 RepID=A0AA41YVX0_9HYPH|nr:Ku protein [Lichenifustis flavocetrariae]MCW6509584.1 Ku protein [Lichenifustis flavocetrariae]